MTELEKIKKIIDQNQKIYIKIFDVLVLKNIRSFDDIYQVLADKVEKKYNIKNFYKLRTEPENKCKIKETETLDSIYEKIKIDKELKEKIKQEEEQLIIQFCYINPFMEKVYKYARDQKKEIELIENTIYSKELIYELMHLKESTSLIPVVITKDIKEILLKETSKSLMISSNNYNVENEKIEIYCYDRIKKYNKANKYNSLSENIIFTINNNYTNNGIENSYWKNFGIKYAAPIYYAFSAWVYEQNKEKDNVCFLARDGYIVKKVFDLIKTQHSNPIESKYIYTSRKAIQLPALVFENKRYAIDTITVINDNFNEKTVLRNFFDYFHIDSKKYESKIYKYGFKSLDDRITYKNILQAKHLVSEEYALFEDAMNKAIKLIKEYLKQEGLADFEEINVVDIGWRGSVQYALSKITEKKMMGYYFATNHDVYNDIFYDVRGFLYDYGFPYELKEQIFKNVMLYEFLFSSPEGSLKKFEKKNNKIIPVLSEEKEYYDELDEIQTSALEIIKEYLNYYEYTKDIKHISAVKPYMDFLEAKKIEDMKMFSTLNVKVGYFGNQQSFVPTFTKEEIKNDFNKFYIQTQSSIWNGAYLVKGIETEKEYNKFKEKYGYREKEHKTLSLYNVKYAITHPKRIIKHFTNR